MGIFSRLFKVGQAKTNQVIDSLERPELMLNQAIKDKDKALAEAKESVANVIAEERRQKHMLDKENEQKISWEQKAQSALGAGKEELAVKALERSEEHSNNAASLQGQWEALRSQVDELKIVIKKSQDEIADLRRNKDLIIAQSKAAEVKKSIYQAKAKIGTKRDTDDLIARMKAKAENSNYQAEAAMEMAEDLDGKDSLEKEFDTLSSSTSTSTAVQDKLAAMKAKMGK